MAHYQTIPLTVLLAAALARTESAPASNPSISASGLFSAAAFSAEDHLNFGGHDPNNQGFNVQNVELVLADNVDPYFFALVNWVAIIQEGETAVELEEAFFRTLSLPAGLEVTGGQFFTRAGRHNAMHPHTWDFADQPVVLNRLYGPDGLRGPGARLAWLAPAPFFWELSAGAQQAEGEIAVSFLGDEGGGGGHDHGLGAVSEAPEEEAVEGIGGYPVLERDTDYPRDLLYHLRSEISWDMGGASAAVLGADYLTGPNNKGGDNRTYIAGGDFYWKWQPTRSRLGFPFVKWQSEFLWRGYEAGPARALLEDFGFYSQASAGMRERWVLGLRAGWADSRTGEKGPLRSGRLRLTPAVTFYPSEFSKIRLQYNFDADASAPEPVHAVFLQAEFNIGAHAAHAF